MTQSLLQLAGLDWPVPDYSTVSRRHKTLHVTIEVASTTTGLHLLVDSTGIKMLGEGECKPKKHGAAYRRQWRKVHLGIDAATLEIRAMEVTDSSIGGAPMLPTYWARFLWKSRSPESAAMALTIRRAAMKPSLYVRPMPSSPS